ncbi:Brix-domain-containing protein [Bimuria novae-zelandiae CBS 107.79]|uniref:Brix-domain-containing protein n=1 Tax=Bimuria novae-zelandiae CBS 107.79 TaxID=1447943 RepID=A0A6A5VMY3_9PLEO|nr:Brix-domain-containing protein [Bimuria novae-zelandiae CBS 107.79]
MARGTSGRRKQSVADKQAVNKPKEGNPKSMVIRIGAGEVGSSVSQLVQDVRQVMQPDTAVRLKERRANKLRDYTTMAGPLGVTHLLLFSRSESGNTNMRLAKTPRGPTLHFRVEQYSLAKDIMKSMKHYRTDPLAYNVAPLLVMNNFITPDATREALGDAAPPKHLEKLVTDMFQGLFPPIQPHTTPLHTIKRVLLLNREPPKEEDNGTVTISLRHYAITTKITGLPKAIRRLHAAERLIKSREKKNHGLPNLGKLEDVADYMLDPSAAGYTSASDTEADTDAEVEVTAPVRAKVMSKKERERAKAGDGASKRTANGSKVEKRAVKLVEIGPRMKLRLTKVEEDICGGRVMWHEFVTKSKEEVQKMEAVWEKRNKEKEERRRIQRENIERKRKERGEAGGGEGEEDEDEEMEDIDEYDMDDDVWHDEDGEKMEEDDE